MGFSKKSQRFVCGAGLALVGISSSLGARPFQGGYVGGGLGIVQLAAKTSQSVSRTPDGKKRPKGHALGAEIAVGYGLNVCNHFFWGTELFFELAAPKVKTRFESRDPISTSRLQHAFGVRVRPGFFLSKDTVLHGTLGLQMGHWKRSFAPPEHPGALYSPCSVSKNVLGIAYGMGVMVQVTPRVSLGGEFVRCQYKGFKNVQPNLRRRNGDVTHSFRGATHSLKFRVVYTWS